MKQIKLRQITLRNWRGEKERTTAFNDIHPTCICGDNGLGKSRHFDAFCWLLFGKDSKERKDYNVRTYDAQHNELHKCECSVEAVISVDEHVYTLKREYKELWVKPRGQVEEVFKGNTTECTWDGVPVRVGDFQKRVNTEIIDETVFKMITNPRYFAEQMKWQQQREVLLEMAGTKSDAEIAAGNADFKAMLEELNGKALGDFRKELAAEKKRLKAEAGEIQPRIDQTQKMMPEAEDWAEVEKEKQRLKANMNAIDLQISDAGKRMDACRKEQEVLKNEIYVLRAEQASIVRHKKEEAQTNCDRENEQRRALESQLKHWHAELADLNIDEKRNSGRLADLQREMEHLDTELAELRKEWYEIHQTVYDEKSNVCPYCGQTLPEEKIAEAQAAFKAKKAADLRANTERGKALAGEKKMLEQEKEERQAKEKEFQHSLVSVQAAIDKYAVALQDAPRASVEEVVPEEIPEWVEAGKEIAEKTKQLEGYTDIGGDDAIRKEQLRQERNMLQMQVDELNARLQKREQIEKLEKEIEKLQARGKALAQMIADVEKREYVASRFVKEKIADCEARINSMFKTVRFKLFDYTQDGNEYETCTMLVDGVPYGVANTARQLNAGLDMINTLCRYGNVSAPIFIDGAESVNRYIGTQAQMIFLIVTREKELVIR